MPSLSLLVAGSVHDVRILSLSCSYLHTTHGKVACEHAPTRCSHRSRGKHGAAGGSYGETPFSLSPHRPGLSQHQRYFAHQARHLSIHPRHPSPPALFPQHDHFPLCRSLLLSSTIAIAPAPRHPPPHSAPSFSLLLLRPLRIAKILVSETRALSVVSVPRTQRLLWFQHSSHRPSVVSPTPAALQTPSRHRSQFVCVCAAKASPHNRPSLYPHAPAAHRGCQHSQNYSPRGPHIPPRRPTPRPQLRALSHHDVSTAIPTAALRYPTWGVSPPRRLPHHPSTRRTTPAEDVHSQHALDLGFHAHGHLPGRHRPRPRVVRLQQVPE
ncbi:hypothetical protein IG631_15033 [Alternaria alternata]|nr:hypothetical protein IG631_15033 [Alternaria alternata]